jgi:hypothetical protein
LQRFAAKIVNLVAVNTRMRRKPLKRRDFLDRKSLVACPASSGNRLRMMRYQCRSHCMGKARDRHSAIRRGGVAAAVAAINLLRGAEKKAHPRQIVVKLEERKIDVAHPRDANQDEFARGITQRTFQTSNLPVKLIAVRSVLAPKDHEKRLTAGAGYVEGLLVVG